MKRSIPLFTLAAAIAWVSLTSYSSAPSRIGSTLLTTGCGTGSCHGNKSTATSVAIVIKNGATTITNSIYIPGTKYQVTITAANSSKSKFGFICYATHGGSHTAGTFANVPSGAQLSTVSGIAMVEHTSPVSSASGLSATFDWTAPAAGTGAVKITAYANAVDGGGTSSNDAFNNAEVTLNESPTSVTDPSPDDRLKIYPNPVKDVLHISNMPAGASKAYIYDLAGRLVIQQDITPGTGINTASLNAGIYTVQLVSANVVQKAAFVKQL